MVNPMLDTLTMEMPFMSEVPKREAKAVRGAWEELEEFQVMAKQRGAVLPPSFAAQLLNVSRQRIFQLVQVGTLETVVIGPHRMILADSLIAWAKSEHKPGRPANPLTSGGIGGGVARAKAAWKYGRSVMAAKPKKKTENNT